MVSKMTDETKAVKAISEAIVKAVSNISPSASNNKSNIYSRSEIDNKFATITYVQQQIHKVNQQIGSVSENIQSIDDKIDSLTEIVQQGIEDILDAIARLSSQLGSSDHIFASYSRTLQATEIIPEEDTVIYSE